MELFKGKKKLGLPILFFVFEMVGGLLILDVQHIAFPLAHDNLLQVTDHTAFVFFFFLTVFSHLL